MEREILKDLIAILRENGFMLRREKGMLLISPASKLDGDTVDVIKANKQAVIECIEEVCCPGKCDPGACQGIPVEDANACSDWRFVTVCRKAPP